MSQAGEIDVVQNNPDIPTSFVTDDGVAVPIANVLEILGTSVAAGSIPVETTGSGNTVTVEVQTSQAIAATDATKIGLASFSTAAFAVDANGFVTLTGGGGAATNIDVDAHTAPGTDPVVPNAGNIIITGAQVASGVVGTNVIRTDSLAANTVTIEIQRSTAVAATDITKNGVSHFNSTEFSVDANGFVSLAGGGIAIDSIGTQTGTNPISPTGAGLVTINGAVVAAGTNPVRSDGTGANTMAIEVQISQAIAAADATKIGLSNFDSARFTVAATGFVSLNGSGVGQTITGQSGGALSPTAGNWNISGAVTAAGTSPVVTSGAVSTLTVNVQTSQALAAADATKIGLSNFDSSSFAVAATGFVTLSTTGVLKTLTGNTGGAISPTANNINTVGTGSITISGSGSTLTTQLTGLTNHAVLIGAGTATITNVGPTSTAGQVLQSAGASADPAFSTATYPSTTTINQILYSSATNTVTGLATANQAVLTTGAIGVPVLTALAVNGQLIIGSTAGVPAAATLTSGAGIAITNGSNSITIAATGAGFTWTDVTTATQTLAAENGYVTDRSGGVTYTLPTSGTLGDTIKIVGKLGIAVITPNANQQILIGSTSGTVGVTGTATANNVGDCIELICITAGASTVWRADHVMGTWTLA